MEGSEHPSWERGKGVVCNVQTPQPFSQTLDLGGISELGGGSEATSAQKSSPANRTLSTHLGEESLNVIATKVAPAVRQGEETSRSEFLGSKGGNSSV